MADMTTPAEEWTTPVTTVDGVRPELETVDERLRKLEQTVASLVDPARVSQMPVDAPGGLAPLAMMQAVLPTLVSKAIDQASPPQPGGFWTRLGLLREVPLMLRMYFDGRYRLSRFCQIAAPTILVMMVLNYLAFAFWEIPVLAPICERLILIGLAVVLYKVWSREVERYSAVLSYLSQYGRT